jgi:MFS transporter, ACS family, solute carrier family 17 (sodium-dependent inorganic phosphate cotransporter), member 9
LFDVAPIAAALAAGITSAAPADKAPVGVVRLLRSSAVWAIIIVNIVNHWGYFIYLNWIPTYFHKVGSDVRRAMR